MSRVQFSVDVEVVGHSNQCCSFQIEARPHVHQDEEHCFKSNTFAPKISTIASQDTTQ